MAKKYTIYTRTFLGGILKNTDFQTVEESEDGPLPHQPFSIWGLWPLYTIISLCAWAFHWYLWPLYVIISLCAGAVNLWKVIFIPNNGVIPPC